MPIPVWAPILTLLLTFTPPPGGRAMEAEPLPSATPVLAAAAARAASTRWYSPLPGALTVTRPFAPPATRWAPGHRGVDLRADTGSHVRAAGSGVVVYAGRLAGRGVISIEHAPGVRTTYEPVRARVRAGQQVSGGHLIGWVSPDRRHSGSLHWGLKVRGTYADPMRLLRRIPVLKPVSRA